MLQHKQKYTRLQTPMHKHSTVCLKLSAYLKRGLLHLSLQSCLNLSHVDYSPTQSIHGVWLLYQH